MYDGFRPSKAREKNREAGVSKNLLPGDRIWKPAFLVAENAVYIWTEG